MATEPTVPLTSGTPSMNFIHPPVTVPEPDTDPVNQTVVTSTPATSEFNQYTTDLEGLLNQLNQVNVPGTGTEPTLENTVNDPFMQALTRSYSTADNASKALIATIQAQRANEGNKIDQQYDNYKRGLQLLGIQHNAAQSTPDLLMGHIQAAENEHRAKIQNLDIEMNKALMDAEAARADKNLSVLREKMAYIKDLKEQKRQALKDVLDTIQTERAIGQEEASMYYDALQKLSPEDQETFLQELANKFKIPLSALISGMVAEKERREDRTEKKKSGTGGGYTAQELRKLRAAGIDASDIETADEYLYGENKGIDPELIAYLNEVDTLLESGDAGIFDGSTENPNNEAGYITAEAFKDMLEEAKGYGISIEDLVDRYKNYLYLRKWKYAQNYGISKELFNKFKTA